MGILDKIRSALSASVSAESTAFESIIKRTYVEQKALSGSMYGFKPGTSPIYLNEVAHWPDDKKFDFIMYCTGKSANYDYEKPYDSPERHMHELRLEYLTYLTKTKLFINDENFESLVQLFAKSRRFHHHQKGSVLDWPIGNVVNRVLLQVTKGGMSEALKRSLSDLKVKLNADVNAYHQKDKAKLIAKIDTVIFTETHAEDAVPPTYFLGKDDFSPFANNVVKSLPKGEQVHWFKIIEKAQKANGSKPSAKYLKESLPLLKDLGTDKFKKVVNEWFAFILQLKPKVVEYTQEFNKHTYTYSEMRFLDSLNSEALKGIIWMSSSFSDQHTLESLTQLAERCYKKHPGVGPVAAAVGNACFYALYKSRGMDGIGKLSRLKQRIKHTMARKTIEKYLTESAKEKGLSQQEIEDMVVDDCGVENGQLQMSFGDYTGVVEITSVGRSVLKWIKPDGGEQKSIPVVVQEKFAPKLKKLKGAQKQINLTLTSQRDRIDWMFRSSRKWNFADFDKYYVQHGLMSYLTKKLIWIFETDKGNTSAIWLNDQWVDVNEKAIIPNTEGNVKLWHPSESSIADIQQWRAFMTKNQIQQPIKQAFREVYILTEAEIRTKTYSNRMAAHILKQHQYASLAKARKWTTKLLGWWDGGDQDTAELKIPEQNLKAEFWVQSVDSENSQNDTGIWPYVSTDQIRFVHVESGELVDLVDVPPVLFSEVLRDVDLFVGVASVGNDPTWNDTGGLPAMRDYWQSFSFGDLSEIAKNRKEILASLLPRLKIAKVAEIKDKYLVVKGSLRTYKIHIGSTNILMEPNDQYLCIVPDAKAKNPTDNLFIPFEGDSGLSIILSKAFLLAEDTKITDSTITTQINRK